MIAERRIMELQTSGRLPRTSSGDDQWKNENDNEECATGTPAGDQYLLKKASVGSRWSRFRKGFCTC